MLDKTKKDTDFDFYKTGNK